MQTVSMTTLRATLLHRQWLDVRRSATVTAASRHLVGLNAQDAHIPYLALWARVAPLSIHAVTAAIEDGVLVRSTLLRATQHLMPPADAALVRALLAPVLARVQRNAFGSSTVGVDLDELVVRARDLLRERGVLTRPELGRMLQQRWPQSTAGALGSSVQHLMPVTHPAPSGTWGVRGPTPFALADWPDPPPEPDRAPALVRRYLAAFGPATAADIRAWSGMTGVRAVVAGMDDLIRMQGPEGQALLDLPGAPLVEGGSALPVRFLPDFDAVLLAHHDRRRVMSDRVRALVCEGAAVAATVLVDGEVSATWSIEDGPRRATLTLRALRDRLPRGAVEAEGERLLGFARSDVRHAIVWT